MSQPEETVEHVVGDIVDAPPVFGAQHGGIRSTIVAKAHLTVEVPRLKMLARGLAKYYWIKRPKKFHALFAKTKRRAGHTIVLFRTGATLVIGHDGEEMALANLDLYSRHVSCILKKEITAERFEVVNSIESRVADQGEYCGVPHDVIDKISSENAPTGE